MSISRQSESWISDRAALIQDAFLIEYLTIAWMVIEAALAIGSAVEALGRTAALEPESTVPIMTFNRKRILSLNQN
jgi:hypothetical protein